MARLAFVTSADHSELHPDDRAALPALERAGISVEAVCWDEEVDWARFDLVVIRSVWDYFHRIAEFEAWLARLEQLGVKVRNPVPTLRWNGRKAYLRELAGHGIPVVETHWVPEGGVESLARILDEHGWKEAVLKPSISGGGFQTHRLTRAEAESLQPELAAITARCEAMVQPFVPEILTEGERSLVFFDRKLSHAMHKRPKPGEFRVQLEHGGTIAEFTPTGLLREVAERAISLVPGPLLYARVDLVKVGEQVLLNELEILEPMLYFRVAPGAAERFAEAVKAHLAGARADDQR
jgi:glutathione synthase/RimK-type ligase-like ATP-grasp enzyme